MTTGPRVVPHRGPAVTEKDLERYVRDAADRFGWLRYHTHRSDFSPAGFPDEVLVRPPRIIFAELKSAKGRPSANQTAWLDLLAECPGVETYLWRPADLEQIAQILR